MARHDASKRLEAKLLSVSFFLYKPSLVRYSFISRYSTAACTLLACSILFRSQEMKNVC
jgi:hypothetical protein